jgi:DNA-binding XRE family transcriptional regulator
MSYEGVPSNGALKKFQTLDSAEDVIITQEDEECLEVCFPDVEGFIHRDAAKRLAIRLMDAAQQPYEAEPDPSTHREKMGLSQEEAAGRIGITRTYLSQIECGTASNVSLRTCRRMAALYDCTIEELGIELPSCV